jgi:predicted RNase H-like HicB family nuclease
VYEAIEMTRRFAVLMERDRDSGVWVTYVPALGNLSTWGETRDEAIANTEEAILGYLEAAAQDGIEVPPQPGEIEMLSVEVAVA